MSKFEQITGRILGRTSKKVRFFRDRKGIAAVEFALLAPVLIIAFIGTFEISEAIIANRKGAKAASTVADLVSQATQMNDAQIKDIFEATKAVVAPYDTSGLKTVVAAVGEDPDDGSVKVMWSKADNTSAWKEGAPPPVPVPAQADLSESWIIYAQTTLRYEAVFPAISKEFFGSTYIEMEETFVTKLRSPGKIEYN